MTEELPARYYPKENLYLPPVRSVRLDTTNKEDDHKLEDCLAHLHRVTRNVAKKWIAEYVDDINQSLMDTGIMDMGTIGRLVYSEGNITFEVCEAGVNTPELYGLDSFHFAKLPTGAHKHSLSSDPTHFTIRLRRTTIHRVMTAAAMLIVALTVILPNYGAFNHAGLQAGLKSAERLMDIFHTTEQPISYTQAEPAKATLESHESATSKPASEPLPQHETITPVAENVAEPTTTETKHAAESADPTSVADIPQPTSQAKSTEAPVENAFSSSLEVKGYCIVMASAVTNKGAEHLIAKLNKEGFPNAVKYKDKGMLRVLLVGYNNEDMARAHAAVVRATDDLYSGTWIKKF